MIVGIFDANPNNLTEFPTKRWVTSPACFGGAANEATVPGLQSKVGLFSKTHRKAPFHSFLLHLSSPLPQLYHPLFFCLTHLCLMHAYLCWVQGRRRRRKGWRAGRWIRPNKLRRGRKKVGKSKEGGKMWLRKGRFGVEKVLGTHTSSHQAGHKRWLSEVSGTHLSFFWCQS